MANINTKQAMKTAVKYSFALNCLVLIVTSFKLIPWVIFTTLSLNIGLLGLYLIMDKFSYAIEGVIVANRMAKQLNNFAGQLNG